MIRRLPVAVSCVVAGFVLGAVWSPPAAAQDQTIDFFVGGFVPRGLDSRGIDDVLFQDAQFLDFRMKDFRGPTAGAEYLVGLGDFFDAGASVAVYSASALAVDAFYTFPSGADVQSELRLRVIPITATFRYLPLGHHDAIEPYVGAGVGIMNWRYTETGDFVALDRTIINGTFEHSETTVGPVILGGVRVPVGRMRLGGEIRYQGGKGDLPTDPVTGFSAPTVNLGGFNYLFTVGVRF